MISIDLRDFEGMSKREVKEYLDILKMRDAKKRMKDRDDEDKKECACGKE